MKQCPYCGSSSYEVETVNQAKMKKCRTCGAYYEDVGEAFEINTFVPVYERDGNGVYPGCPKCGCREVRCLSAEELLIRGGLLTSLIAGEPHERAPFLLGKYECQNPACRYRWD